jgi:hypothetical protein
MAGGLSQAERSLLAATLKEMCERPRPEFQHVVYTWFGNGKSLDLDAEGYQKLRDAATILQSVQAWKEAYPFDTLAKRIIESLATTETYEETVAELTAKLDADCKELVAYAPIFGFNLVDGASIAFGPHILEALGDERVESEIIGRLKEHTANLDEPLRSQQVEQFRGYLAKHCNVPILRVRFHGSTDGAVEYVHPTAEAVAAFIQAAIGMLTDQNDHIIDHRGRFTGEFRAMMPVMTPTFDQISFPDVRGFPYRVSLRPEDVERLQSIGMLDLAETYVSPQWASDEAMDALLCRALGCFADGERGVTDNARIGAYVSALDVFFSERGRAKEAYAVAVATLTHGERESFEAVYDLAKVIYEQRSEATHDGYAPSLAYPARMRAKRVILQMLDMRGKLATKDDVKAWIRAKATAVRGSAVPSA